MRYISQVTVKLQQKACVRALSENLRVHKGKTIQGFRPVCCFIISLAPRQIPD